MTPANRGSEPSVEPGRDLKISGGCPVCDGDLDVRIGPNGAVSYCARCVRISSVQLLGRDGMIRVAQAAAMV